MISANVEGFSTAKQQTFACKRPTEEAITHTLIPGMVLASERLHRQYGSAISTKVDSVVDATTISDANDIEVLSVELSSVVVTSAYKPPSVDFNFPQPVPLATATAPSGVTMTLIEMVLL